MVVLVVAVVMVVVDCRSDSCGGDRGAGGGGYS